MGGGPRAISASCAASSGLCFRPLAIRSIVGIVRLRGPFKVVISLNNRATVGLTPPLSTLNIPVVNASIRTVSETRGESSFRGIVGRLKVPRPGNLTMASVRRNIGITREVNCPILMHPSFILNNETVRVITDRRDLHRCLRATIRVGASRPILISGCVVNHRLRISTVYSNGSIFIPNVVRRIREANIRDNSSVSVCPAFSISRTIGSGVVSCAIGLNGTVGVVNLFGVRFVTSRGSSIFMVRIGPESSEAIPFLSGTASVPVTSVTAEIVLNRDLGSRNVARMCPTRGGH